jgi:hypothetical protein
MVEEQLQDFDVRNIKYAIDKHPVYIYSGHEIRTKITDANDVKREYPQIYYAAEIGDYDFLIGLSWLTELDPDIRWPLRKWFYRPEQENRIQVLDREKFRKELISEVISHENTVLGALILPPEFFLFNGSVLSVSWQVRRRVHREHVKSKKIAARSLTIRKKVPIPQVKLSEEGIPKACKAYEDVFSETEVHGLPDTARTTHAIDLQNEGEPPYGSIYKLSESELEVLRNYLAENMERGWIKKSTFSAGAPILFVKKPDRNLRLYVDYRAFNKLTIKNRHSLPLIDETIDRLTEVKMYTKLDLRDAYHRIRIKPGDKW